MTDTECGFCERGIARDGKECPYCEGRGMSAGAQCIEDEVDGTVPCPSACEQDIYAGLSFEQRQLLDELIN